MPEAAPAAPAGLTLGIISQEHPEYDGELCEKLRLLKCGGFEILSHAKNFLVQMPGESAKFYNWRKDNASYINYLGPLIGFLTGSLFAQPLSVNEPVDAADSETPGDKSKQPSFWDEFGNDCDLSGTAFSDFAEALTQDALLYRRAIARVDLPMRPEVELNSLADEDKLNVRRVWVDHVPVHEMINWKLDTSATNAVRGRKRFEWATFKTRVTDSSSPFSDQRVYRLHFEIWRMLGGQACFTRYQSPEYNDKDKKPKETDVMELVQATTPTSFRELPFIQLDIGDELWVGNKAGPLAMEHYRDRSNLKSDMAKSLCEIPFVKKGPEMPAVHGAYPSEAQQNPNRGNDPAGRYADSGWLEIGAEDELGFAGPSGRAHELGKGMLDDLRDEIHRSTHAMALSLSNSATTVGRSGDSKMEDRQATTQVLKALANKVRGWAKNLYTCASQARGEDIQWQAAGVDSYDHEDRPLLIQEAPIVMALNIESPTFQKEYKAQIAEKVLPNVSQQTKAQIRKEIEEGVDENTEAEEQRKELMSRGEEATVKVQENAANAPPAPGGPGKPPPSIPKGKPAKPGKAA